MNKKLLLPAAMILCVTLLPMVHAESQIAVIHFEGKAAIAICRGDYPYMEVFGAVEGLLNVPWTQGPLKGMFVFAIYIDTSTRRIMHFDVSPLMKGQFKWSMDHATLVVGPDPDTFRWDTVPPTWTGHVNIKDLGFLDLDHVVVNVGARFAHVTENCEPLCCCGIVVHGTGTLIFNLS